MGYQRFDNREAGVGNGQPQSGAGSPEEPRYTAKVPARTESSRIKYIVPPILSAIWFFLTACLYVGFRRGLKENLSLKVALPFFAASFLGFWICCLVCSHIYSKQRNSESGRRGEGNTIFSQPLPKASKFILSFLCFLSFMAFICTIVAALLQKGEECNPYSPEFEAVSLALSMAFFCLLLYTFFAYEVSGHLSQDCRLEHLPHAEVPPVEASAAKGGASCCGDGYGSGGQPSCNVNLNGDPQPVSSSLEIGLD